MMKKWLVGMLTAALILPMTVTGYAQPMGGQTVLSTEKESVTALDGQDLESESESIAITPIAEYKTFQNEILITLSLSEEDQAILREHGGPSLTVFYKNKGVSPGLNGSGSIVLSNAKNYTSSRTLSALPAGAELEITYSKTACGPWDSDVSFTDSVSTVKVIESELSFYTEGLSKYCAKVRLTDGYDSEKTYSVDHIYFNVDIDGSKFISSIGMRDYKLSADNQFTVEIKELPGINSYSGTSEIYVFISEDGAPSGTGQHYLGSASILKQDVSKYLEVSVSDVTYTTATVNVKVKDFDVFHGQDLAIRVMAQQKGVSVPTCNGNHGTMKYHLSPKKPEAMVSLHGMGPSREYEVYMDVENENGDSFYSIPVSVDFQTLSAKEFEPFTGPVSHTKQEIAEKWKSLSINTDLKDEYATSVNHTTGGVLNDKTLNNAVNIVNIIRYCSGLPADLLVDKGDSSAANAAGEINRLLGKFPSHVPDRPSGVTEDFYIRGYNSANSSNLGKGYASVPDAIIRGWMRDNSGSEVNNTLNGHRNHNMSPEQTILGFGKSGSYYAEQVFNRYDNLRPAAEKEKIPDSYFYSWPAKLTPVEVYMSGVEDYSNSIYLHGYSYAYDDLKVTIANQTNHKTYVLTSADDYFKQKNELGSSGYTYIKKYLSASDNPHGTDSQIVFQVDPFQKGDKVRVTVEGLYVNDKPATIDYTMEFFSVKDVSAPDVAVESVQIIDPVSEMVEGEQRTFTAKVLPENASDSDIVWSVESVDGRGDGSITQNGVFTAAMDGVVRIQAASKSFPEVSDHFELEIKEKYVPAKSISLSSERMTLYEGESEYLMASVDPVDTTDADVFFKSSAPEKVTALDGVIKALAATEEPAKITAFVVNRDQTVVSADCMVTVLENNSNYEREYASRLYDMRVDSDFEIPVGATSLLKVYPVYTGAPYDRSACSVTVNGNSSVSIKQIEDSEITDDGFWFEIKGLSKGSAALTLTAKCNYGSGSTPDEVMKKMTLKVVEKAADMAQAEPVLSLVTKSVTVNTNKERGVLLDIRNPYTAEADNVPTLTSADGSHEYFVLEKAGDKYNLHAKGDTKKGKYQLQVLFPGEGGNHQYNLKCSVVNTFPKAKAKQTQTFDPSDDSAKARFTITSKEPIDTVTWDAASDYLQLSEVTHKDAKTVTVTLSGNGARSSGALIGCFKVKYRGYRESAPVSVKIKSRDLGTKKNALVLDQDKVTISSSDTERAGAILRVLLKNSSVSHPDRIVLKPADEKTANAMEGGALAFSYTKSTGKLKVKPVKKLMAGTMKFTVEGYLEKDGIREKLPTYAVLAITVTDKPITFSLKASGKMDLLCRESSCVTLTPKLKNMSGKIMIASPDEESGRRFQVKVDPSGSLSLFARKGADVLPNRAYEVVLRVTYDNGRVFENQKIQIKPSQSSMKVIAPKNLTLFKNQKEDLEVPITVKAPLGGEISAIDAISLPRGLVYQDGVLHIANRDLLRPGKHVVKLAVIPANAYKSVKPITVNIKLLVK